MALQPTKLAERLGSFTAPKGHLLGYMCAHLHLNGWKGGKEGGGVRLPVEAGRATLVPTTIILSLFFAIKGLSFYLTLSRTTENMVKV